MFLLVSVRHVGAHPDELQHGVSIQSSINLGKTFPRISRIRIIPSTQILARVFVYLPPFISKILDFISRMVLIFILTYFEWRDTENQQYFLYRKKKCSNFKINRLQKLNFLDNSRKFLMAVLGHHSPRNNKTFYNFPINKLCIPTDNGVAVAR